MKIFTAVLLMMFTVQSAQAEFYAECKLIGGAEQALKKAPDEVYIDEAGDYWLSEVKGEVQKDFSTEKANLVNSSQGSQIRLKSVDTASSLVVEGLYALDVRGCGDKPTVRANYTWRYANVDMPQTNGLALYDCTCTED